MMYSLDRLAEKLDYYLPGIISFFPILLIVIIEGILIGCRDLWYAFIVPPFMRK